jgi:putative transposase
MKRSTVARMKRSAIRDNIDQWCTIGGRVLQAVRSFSRSRCAIDGPTRWSGTWIRCAPRQKQERARRPFEIEAMVVLPDHMHAVWTLPENDADFSDRWRAIKSGFVRRLRTQGVALKANAKGEHEVWQRRFWEHQIRDESDLARHVDYIHINPVKHRLVERVVDWRWSTFHRYVRLGVLPANWAAEPCSEGAFGE